MQNVDDDNQSLTLSEKEKTFVEEMKKHGDYTLAAIACGYPKSTAKKTGYAINQQANVKSHLEDFARQERIRRRDNYGKGDYMVELDKDLDRARKRGNMNAVAAILKLKGQTNGLLIDKTITSEVPFSVNISGIDKPREVKEAKKPELIEEKNESKK